ncbi:MAG: hypothetical protein K2X38_25370 [Gemmataceae bacterium]|nr:hypothetical protein [Gemmataceae bacterium]
MSAVWGISLVAGICLLADYATKPGPQRELRDFSSSQSGPDGDRFALVVAIHPHCPCSEATLIELDAIRQNCGDRIRLHLLVVGADSTEEIPNWLLYRFPPGVLVRADPEGEEAKRYGAETSGHAALFDPAGRCRFQGGITQGRGHAGDNLGRQGILAIVRGQNVDGGNFPVFGCRLPTSSLFKANP